MDKEPKRLSLKEVIEGVKRAAKRVEAWPEWKKRWVKANEQDRWQRK